MTFGVYLNKIKHIIFIFEVAIIKNKTKEQLSEDIKILNDRISQLEHKEAEQRQLEEAIHQLAGGISAATGDAFFKLLVQHLTRIIGVDYSFVGKLIGKENDRIRTIAICGRGGIAEDFEYYLTDTPCQNVIRRSKPVSPTDLLKKIREVMDK